MARRLSPVPCLRFLALSVGHGIGMNVSYALYSPLGWPVLVALDALESWPLPGTALLLVLPVLGVTSLRCFRRASFAVFKFVHVGSMLVFVALGVAHQSTAFLNYASAGVALWVVDVVLMAHDAKTRPLRIVSARLFGRVAESNVESLVADNDGLPLTNLRPAAPSTATATQSQPIGSDSAILELSLHLPSRRRPMHGMSQFIHLWWPSYSWVGHTFSTCAPANEAAAAAAAVVDADAPGAASTRFTVFMQVSRVPATWTRALATQLQQQAPSHADDAAVANVCEFDQSLPAPVALYASGPFGTAPAFFGDGHEHDAYILVGGGVGITALLPFWEHLLTPPGPGPWPAGDERARKASGYAPVSPGAQARRKVALAWVFRDACLSGPHSFVDRVVSRYVQPRLEVCRSAGANYPAAEAHAPELQTDVDVDASLHLFSTAPAGAQDIPTAWASQFQRGRPHWATWLPAAARGLWPGAGAHADGEAGLEESGDGEHSRQPASAWPRSCAVVCCGPPSLLAEVQHVVWQLNHAGNGGTRYVLHVESFEV